MEGAAPEPAYARQLLALLSGKLSTKPQENRRKTQEEERNAKQERKKLHYALELLLEEVEASLDILEVLAAREDDLA
jgi:hypothetical protein